MAKKIDKLDKAFFKENNPSTHKATKDKGEEKKPIENKKRKLIFYVVITATMIFILWAFTLPTIFSVIKRDTAGNKSFLNGDAKEALYNIRDAFKEFGQKLENTTSTEAESEQNNEDQIATSTKDGVEEKLSEDDLLRLKEKIIEEYGN